MLLPPGFTSDFQRPLLWNTFHAHGRIPTGLSPSAARRSRRVWFRSIGMLRRVHNTTSPGCLPSRIQFALIPVRSLLLRKSRLISFPPGTKMFPFPGFPLPKGSLQAYWAHKGCPIRGSPDLNLRAVTRSISLLVTPFIGARAKGSTA